jgi:hypothetical protein
MSRTHPACSGFDPLVAPHVVFRQEPEDEEDEEEDEGNRRDDEDDDDDDQNSDGYSE